MNYLIDKMAELTQENKDKLCNYYYGCNFDETCELRQGRLRIAILTSSQKKLDKLIK